VGGLRHFDLMIIFSYAEHNNRNLEYRVSFIYFIFIYFYFCLFLCR